MLTLEKLFNGEKYPGLIGDIKTVAWQSKWILTAWAFYKSNFIYQYRHSKIGRSKSILWCMAKEANRTLWDTF